MKTLRMLCDYHTRILRGHFWAWRGDFEDGALADVEPGEVVRLEGSGGEFLGTGFANPRSHIAVRLMDPTGRVPDESLLAERLDRALAWRARVRKDEACLRFVYGESDGLPGLVVDRYGPVLVLSQTVAGMEPWTDFLVAELARRLAPQAIVVKNTNRLRLLEGLPLGVRVAFGSLDGPVEVPYDGGRVVVDCLGGRKTGLFLDHRENRRFLASLLLGKERVLDLFGHVGLWSHTLLAHGAGHAVCVESDPAVTALGRLSARASGWEDRLDFVEADAGTFLQEDTSLYDVVVLDPPAFAKRKRYLKNALELYALFNQRALARLAPGGIFATSSCSSFLSDQDLERLVQGAASALGRRLHLVGTGGQALDHPILLAMPETRYLSCLFFHDLG